MPRRPSANKKDTDLLKAERESIRLGAGGVPGQGPTTVDARIYELPILFSHMDNIFTRLSAMHKRQFNVPPSLLPERWPGCQKGFNFLSIEQFVLFWKALFIEREDIALSIQATTDRARFLELAAEELSHVQLDDTPFPVISQLSDEEQGHPSALTTSKGSFRVSKWASTVFARDSTVHSRTLEKMTWEEHELLAMTMAIRQKFTCNLDLGKWLIEETGDRPLVLASADNRRWGIGFAWEGALAQKNNWGENVYGKALTKIRDELREDAGLKEQIASRDRAKKLNQPHW